jgi:hypothetical protein
MLLLCGRVVETLGYDLQRAQKRSDPRIFIVLLQHLFGRAEESCRKPNPLAQEYKAEVIHKKIDGRAKRYFFLLCLLSSFFRFNFECSFFYSALF